MIKSFVYCRNLLNSKAMSSLSKFKLPTLTADNFQKLFTPELVSLSNLFIKYNYELRIAGGAVRDLLMNKMVADVDFATTATPDEMKAMFEREQVRLINNNGEKHGTITCRINDKENFEVTTLRIDVETDGRHAKVEFTKDWQLDAERRDLTINSMFLDLDGFVYDYFGGHDDLLNQRIKFVGNPEARIREDYLRILRYFRFYGRIAKDGTTHDEASLQAIENNAVGLKGISGERIWVELKKIVTGKFADSIFRTMQNVGVNEYIGLTGDLNFVELGIVHRRILDLNPSAITLISALLTHQTQLDCLHKRVKMSNYELQIATFILNYRHTFSSLRQPDNYPNNDNFKRDDRESNKSDLLIKDDPYLTNKTEEVITRGHTTNSAINNGNAKPSDLDTMTSRSDDSEIRPIKHDTSPLDDPLFELCRDLILDPSVTTQGVAKTKASVEELLLYANARSTLEKVRSWQPPKFPVDGTRLVEMGVPRGPEFSRVLKRLRDRWRESRYAASEEELLGSLKREKKDLIR